MGWCKSLRGDAGDLFRCEAHGSRDLGDRRRNGRSRPGPGARAEGVRSWLLTGGLRNAHPRLGEWALRPFESPPSRSTPRLSAPRSFPWAADTIYLDHASIGPLPERTRQALACKADRRTMPFSCRTAISSADGGTSRRRSPSSSTRAGRDRPATVNTSFGLAVAARALPFERGDCVLVRDREFPANVYPWMRLRETGV